MLATARRAALPGREPMNPRKRQYGLGGTLDGWSRLERLTPRQRRALRLAYRGRNPFTFSRHGRDQLRALAPGTTVIVKDPYAALSLPTVTSATGAHALLVFRHPAACLASYRRIGWSPAVDELGRALRGYEDVLAQFATELVPWPPQADLSPVTALGVYWTAINAVALADVLASPVGTCFVVSHEELAAGSGGALRKLMAHVDLEPGPTTPPSDCDEDGSHATPSSGPKNGLHGNLDRDPTEVASAWRRSVDESECRELEETARGVYDALGLARIPLSNDVPGW